MPRTEVTGSQIKDQSVSLTADVTGTLPVGNGGTGSTTLTLNNVLLGNGTGAFQNVAPGTSGNILTSDGTTWTATKVLSNPQISGALYDVNGKVWISPIAVTDAVNYVSVQNSVTNSSVAIYGNGTDANVSLALFGKANGTVSLRGGNTGRILDAIPVTNGVNYVNVTQSATGSGPTIAATGTDTNVDLNLNARGSGWIKFSGTSAVASGGLTYWYNTTDQTTNFERVRAYWQDNVFFLAAQAGGTGTVRTMRIGNSLWVNGTTTAANATSGSTVAAIVNSGAATVGQFGTAGTLSAANGIQYALSACPTINQSGTAGYTGLLINPTITATGSGIQRLIDAQVGGSTKFAVSSAGSTIHAAGSTIELYNTADQTTNFEKGYSGFASGRYELGTLQAGTGSTRNLRLGIGFSGASSVSRFLQIQSGAPCFQFWPGANLAAGDYVHITGTTTISSGVVNYLSITPTINQSGTAGYTGLSINATETTTGSGAKRLIDAQIGGSTRFNVDNLGNVFANGSINLGHESDTAIVRTAPGIVTIAGREVVRRTLQTITSATAISTTSGDQSVIINTGGLPTLGTAVGATCEIKLRNNTSAGVLIATTSSQTIDGLSTFTLPANHAVTLVPNNGNWSVF